jgi:hypothetical protein
VQKGKPQFSSSGSTLTQSTIGSSKTSGNFVGIWDLGFRSTSTTITPSGFQAGNLVPAGTSSANGNNFGQLQIAGNTVGIVTSAVGATVSGCYIGSNSGSAYANYLGAWDLGDVSVQATVTQTSGQSSVNATLGSLGQSTNTFYLGNNFVGNGVGMLTTGAQMTFANSKIDASVEEGLVDIGHNNVYRNNVIRNSNMANDGVSNVLLMGMNPAFQNCWIYNQDGSKFPQCYQTNGISVRPIVSVNLTSNAFPINVNVPAQPNGANGVQLISCVLGPGLALGIDFVPINNVAEMVQLSNSLVINPSVAIYMKEVGDGKTLSTAQLSNLQMSNVTSFMTRLNYNNQANNSLEFIEVPSDRVNNSLFNGGPMDIADSATIGFNNYQWQTGSGTANVLGPISTVAPFGPALDGAAPSTGLYYQTSPYPSVATLIAASYAPLPGTVPAGVGATLTSVPPVLKQLASN